jgi:hypothetical protein
MITMAMTSWYDISTGWRTSYARELSGSRELHLTLEIGALTLHASRYKVKWLPTSVVHESYLQSNVYRRCRSILLGPVTEPVLETYPLGNTAGNVLEWFTGIDRWADSCYSANRQALASNGVDTPNFMFPNLMMDYLYDYCRICGQGENG